MLGTGSWGKELAGGSIDIDFNLLSGSWEVVWLACLAVEAGCGFFGEHVDFWVIVGVCPMGKIVKLKIWRVGCGD